MDIDHLQYVVTLARCLNFSRAAEELHITQPALSQRILQIEGEFGIKLFDRGTRSVALTVAGEHFVAQARQVLHEFFQLQAVAARDAAAHCETLQVGILLNMTHLDLNARILAFQKAQPHILLAINEMVGSIELVRLLEQERFDVVFFNPAPDIKLSEKLKTCPVLTGQVVAVMAKGHRLAARSKIALADLAAEDLLFPVKAHSLFGTIMTACRREGFEPHIVAQISQVDTGIRMAAAGRGITLLSSLFLPELDDTVAVPLDPPITRHIAIAYRTKNIKAAAIAAFCGFMVNRQK